MNIKLTKRVNGIAESATLAISAKAKRLKDEGVDVVNFGVGEPDFNTPDYIIEAAISAMKNGLTKYTPASGIPDLKRAVAEETERALGIRFQPEQVVIGAGAKQPLYNAIASIVEEGDEVIIPVPYWVTYPELVKYLGGKCVFVQTKPENSYKITAEELREAITPRTRAFILNSPNNPTGAVYSSDELKALSDEITRRDGMFVISDEIYRNLVYDGQKHVSIASFGEEIKNRTIIVDGMSKSYAMTGWRVGWAIAPLEIAKAMTRAQSHITSNVNSIAQYASLAALTERENSEKFISEMHDTFEARRNAAIERLYERQISFIRPCGAFYILADISKLLGKTSAGGKKIDNSFDFADALLTENGVAVVPGAAFGAEGYVRLSYASDIPSIEKGIDKLSDFIKNCKE